MKLLGVQIHQDFGWDTNTAQICIEYYSRVKMLSRLKVCKYQKRGFAEDLQFFMKSVPAYDSGTCHFLTRKTQQQKTQFKVIQSTCFQIILGNDYTAYDSALKCTH